ncbi:MAG: DNA helicase RecQ [Gammaproteobacteria bacterium]|nr:DNA helicase RecQ [Gammaproteobacteria bacterium]
MNSSDIEKIKSTALQLLQEKFGFQNFRLNQQDVIFSLLEGQDVLTLMPTGGGKSLCYQIPALIRAGTAIVVSPLIALMQDQVNALHLLNINAAFLNSTQELSVSREVERQLLNGQRDLLCVAPERLVTERFLSLLDQASLALFAIDEAHCVSQWGHDFRPEYQQLKTLAERYPSVPRIALTATADSRTRKEIIQQLDLHQANVFINSFDRPNIYYEMAEHINARHKLWQFIEQRHPENAGIVYCLSRKKVESTAVWLANKGRTALPYHAGLPSEVREQHQQRFLHEEGVIIVATIAFGMGIDKPDVRFVAHLNLPKSIEAYYQETGRAGRDGLPADAWMSYGLQDVIMLRQMMMQSDASEMHKRVVQQKLEAMLGLTEIMSCRRQSLLEYFDEARNEPCGHCDNCITTPESWNATRDAQKALSCVYRTGQRFGVNYVIDVLIGKKNDRICQFGHDQLSTYGIGSEISQTEWRVIIRQLIALGYLTVDADAYGALKLTDNARPLLKGEMELSLRKIARNQKPAIAPKKRVPQEISTEDLPLWEALRKLRISLAKQQGVPPYVIFHDATLKQMVIERPANLNEMAELHGIGDSKLKLYGQSFLQEIQNLDGEISGIS